MSIASGNDDIAVSIVLNVMGLRELAVYGFRSWLLQDFDRPFEIIVNLFSPCRETFDPLLEGKSSRASVRIDSYQTPEFFNVSAANNLGLHHSRGKYVMFANADIIYPSSFLRRAMFELTERNAAYAVAARCNMSAEQTKSTHRKSPLQYTLADGFAHLAGWEREEGIVNMVALSPWMLRRDVAVAIGGFDPNVMTAEDRDLDYRLLHYLRRKNLQQATISYCNLYGYHQHHENTGVVNAIFRARAVMEPRARRLEADPLSTEDCVPTPLEDFDALKRQMQESHAPPAGNQYRRDWRGKLRRRAKRVWKALTGPGTS